MIQTLLKTATLKKAILFIMAVFLSRISFAQYNLVPNPSFEQYTICPNGYGQITRAVGWNIPLLFSTADYFDSCNTIGNVDVPQNYYGYEPARTGGAYVGVVTYQILNMQQRNYREFVQTELTDSLEAGVDYCVRWYVSACDSCDYVCNNMGMYFSPVQINDTCIPNQCNLNYLPQVENPLTNNLNSRNGWTEISGSYTALGGEKFIVIGNFRDTANTTATYTGWHSSINDLNYVAFYYLDDVLVTPCDSLTGINEEANNPIVRIYPNPFQSMLSIETKTQIIQSIYICDITGRSIYKIENVYKNKEKINLENLSIGIYFLQTITNKSQFNYKLLKT